MKEFRKNGQLHRMDGPALIPDSGDWHFFLNGEEVNSQVIYGQQDYPNADHIVESCPDGSIVCIDSQGRLHNRRGAAYIAPDGTCKWFIEGEQVYVPLY